MSDPIEQRLREIEEREKAATEGPWAFESCGEKGDGAEMIGVVFGPDDENCDRPLSGELPAFDDDGGAIEYYRDELVAVCDHSNRRPHVDATFIAAARTDIPWLLARLREAHREIQRLQAIERGVNEALNSGDGSYRP